MNIVLVIFDTLRQDHIGAYGNEWIKTPHFDAFAKESVIFTHCYPESLPTLPVRRALHTSKRVFPYRDYKFTKGERLLPVPGWGPLPNEDETVSEILKANGYRTAMISDCYHMFKPSGNYHRGFDTWHFIRGQELDAQRTKVMLDEAVLNRHMNERMRQEPHIIQCIKEMIGNTSFRRTEEDYFPAMVFRQASNWLAENQDADRIFMVVDSFDPHEPWDPPQYYRKMYDPEDDVADLVQSPYYFWKDSVSERELKRLQANYAGEVSLCDRWFGHFIESLKVSGRWDDTIVAVISDHGHNLGYDPKDKGLVSKQGFPLTRGVADLVLMVRHPSGEGAGMKCDKLVQNFDLTATLLGMADVKPNPAMEGINFWPMVLDESLEIRDHTTTGWGSVVTVVNKEWWYSATLWGEQPMLFSMTDDPMLITNVAADHPDVCKRMHEMALKDAKGEIPEYLKGYLDRVGAYSPKGWCAGPFRGGGFSAFWKDRPE